MTIAEIHGKISETGTNLSERMEDLLTSDVFGCLRYLSVKTALLPFLLTARSFHGSALKLDGEIVRVLSAFWPWLRSTAGSCEPDVVLGFETEDRHVHLVTVEAKYYSTLSREEDESRSPSNQLARELIALSETTTLALGWEPDLQVASRILLYVTPDMAMPRIDLARALHELRQKRGYEGDIFWTSWRRLQPKLEEGLATESDPGRRTVMEDMLELLLRKGLTMFQGVEPVTRRFTLSDFEFYRSGSRSYTWPRIPDPADVFGEYTYQVVNHG